MANDIAENSRLSTSVYFSVGLVAGSVIALQIVVMRIFAVGSWVHFGSLVISLAMFGFGLASALMCIGTGFFDRHWRLSAASSLMLFGPLAVGANLAAQQVPFNAIFLISDPAQKWRLVANFLLYFLPFLAGAFFLGSVFLKARSVFARVYFADLAGSGLSGLAMLGAMYVLAPADLILAPLALWTAGGLLWFRATGSKLQVAGFVLSATLAIAAHIMAPSLGLTTLAVSDYKAVSYARKFPDAEMVYRNISPFGDLEIYSSSYLHFAPGLSDNAAFNLPEEPANAYLAMYNDGEGPTGIIRNLTDAQTTYFHYLPMYYPYVIKSAPDTFVAQLSGGIPVAVALRAGSAHVTAAEANPQILNAFASKAVADFTGDIIHNPKLEIVGQEGRLWLPTSGRKFDVVDLSLGDGAGLSSPGGFAISEKYAFTREAMSAYMAALSDGGVLSVTLWNKEDPPKSILKLYATMVEAAGGANAKQSFYVVSSYLSTTTVLYKRGGFSADEIAKLAAFTHSLSFDEIYFPSMSFDESQTNKLLADYNAQIFGTPVDATQPAPTDGDVLAPLPDGGTDGAAPTVVPATTLERLIWHSLMQGSYEDVAHRYVFDIRPLTNDRPYFAAYVKPSDLGRITDRLDLFQDDWAYLLLWATLGIASALSIILVALPAIFGWRSIFSKTPGKFGTIVYFACLGFGYIMTEVGLISKFVLALANPTISASVLLSGILVFSGLGSMVSERFLENARRILPIVLTIITGLLLVGSLFIDPVLNWIGGLTYSWRLISCILLVAPTAFLMGFPMPIAMTSLGRLGKQSMFLWAWGINGCASVIGAALVPVLATAFGISSVLQASAFAYLVAIPCFLMLTKNGIQNGEAGMRRRFLKQILAVGTWTLFAGQVAARPAFKPNKQAISKLIAMDHSPFPYDGNNPETGEPFLNVFDGKRRGHKSPRGGINWEDVAYNDRRSLFYLPAGFNLNQPAALVVFFHGNNATLARDVIRRQHVTEQLAASGLNAVLVAPQFAFDVRDSSPGNFWREGYFAAWLTEVETHLAELHRAGVKASDFNKLPVILVAYSGGYFPAAWCIKNGGTNNRISGLVLMDALYGDIEKFAAWIAAQRKTAFVFSAYSKASRQWNLQLQALLTEQGIGFSNGLPDKLKPASISFVETSGNIEHEDYLSQAWTKDPLRWIFQRISQFHH